MGRRNKVPTNIVSCLAALCFAGVPFAIELTQLQASQLETSSKRQSILAKPKRFSPKTEKPRQSQTETTNAIAPRQPHQADVKAALFRLPHGTVSDKAIISPAFYAHNLALTPQQVALSQSKFLVVPKQPIYDKIKATIRPLAKFRIGREQADTIQKALNAVRKGDKDAYYANLAQVTSKAGRKLVQWYGFSSHKIPSSSKDIRAFMDANPDWPQNHTLRVHSEQGFSIGPSKQLSYFKKRNARTDSGKLNYAQALMASGNKTGARKVIRDIWLDMKTSSPVIKHIRANHLSYLTRKDHETRLDRLLYLNKKSRLGSANAMLKHVGTDMKKAAQFRMAVIQRHVKKARTLRSQLTHAQKQLPGVHLSTVILLRRSKQQTTATKLLVSKYYKPGQIAHRDKWWLEQRTHVRAALASKRYKLAYKIAKNHSHPSVNLHKDAEFLAGWTALRFLKQPSKAIGHFQTLVKIADGPRSNSRAHYWLGRALAANGQKTKADNKFKKGAAFFNTYYGQLSRHALAPKTRDIYVSPPVLPSASISKSFRNSDIISAILIADQLNENTIIRRMLSHLRYRYKTPQQFTLLAELAQQLDQMQSAVRIGKTGLSKNYPMAHYAYPVVALPPFKPLRRLPERAILYSIARQETEFNATSISHAGARGILQVMPATARGVARRYGLKYRKTDLTTNPTFNLRIASAYIGDRWDEFNGSYIMTFAGYNAGPGRVRQWVRQFGDPRTRSVDPVDWVEMIPFDETRNYVQKVLANVQVYRARLGRQKNAMQIARDLYRGGH